MRPERTKLILRVLGFLLLPLFLVTGLVTCNVVNPMAMAFLTSFEVVNSTPEDIWVTPIGAVGKEGRRRTLPLSSSSRFYIMGTRRSEFHIPPGASLSFTYDWDDVQFSEILCRTANETYRLLPTGLHPTEQQYRSPLESRFVITGVSTLEPAAESHLSALEGGQGGGWLPYLLAALGLLSPLCFWIARRIRTAAAAVNTPQSTRGES